MTDSPRCRGVRGNGEPCKVGFALSADGYCMTHDPERREAAIELRRAGGRNSRAKVKAERAAAAAKIPAGLPKAPKTLEDAVHWSSWAMHAVATGAIDARTAHECGYLIARFTEALNKRDLLAEIEQLRRELAAARGKAA